MEGMANAFQNENSWNLCLQHRCDGMMSTHHHVCSVRRETDQVSFVWNFCASKDCLQTAEERLGGSVADWYQVKKRIHYVAVGIHHSGDKGQMLHCSLVSRFVDKQRELLSAQEFTDVLATLLSKNIFYDGSALRPATAHILCNLGIIACCFDNVN